MLGRESPQRSLFGARLSVEHLLTPGSFYEVLYRESDRLLSDEDFAACYDLTTGRPSVPPSRMAKLLVLQTSENLSDPGGLKRMPLDLRWKAVLGMEVGEPPVGQATLVDFRARLQLRGQMRRVFDRFLALAVEAGLIRPETVQAVDSTAIWGRGTVEDTYNLLGRAMRKLLGTAAKRRGQKAAALAAELQVVLADPADPKSLKGRAGIDWEDAEQRRAFLNRVVEEARHLLAATGEDQQADPGVAEAVHLLRRLLLQDLGPVEPTPARTGGSPDEGEVRVWLHRSRCWRRARRSRSAAGWPRTVWSACTIPKCELGTRARVTPGKATSCT